MTRTPAAEPKRARLRMALCGLVILGSIAACSDPSEGNGESQSDRPRSGGTLTIATPEDAKTLNPFQWSTKEELIRINQLYSSLTRFDPKTGDIVADLATTWNLSPDGLTLSMRLRPGVKFADGKALKAEDVVYSLTTAAGTLSTKTAPLLTSLSSVDVAGDDGVSIHLKARTRSILGDLAQIFIVPAGFTDYNTHPIGTGPFQFESWQHNQSLTLTKNPNYWATGKPYLDRVVFTVVPDPSTRVLQLINGEVQMIAPTAPFAQVQQLKSAGLNLALPNQVGGYYDVRINTRIQPWDNKSVRQALSYAIDRQAIEDSLLGTAIVSSNPIPETSTLFDKSAASYNQQDIAKAKSLLKAAGYPNGVEANMIALCSAGLDYKNVAQVIATSAKDAGFDISLQCVETTAFTEMLGERNFTLGSAGGATTPDPLNSVFKAWFDQNADAIGWLPNHPEVRDLYTRAIAATSDSEFEKLVFQIQQIEQDEQNRIYVGGKLSGPALQKYVRGFVAESYHQTFLDSVWLAK